MSTPATSACAVTMIGLLHSFRKYLNKPPVSLPSPRKSLIQPPVKLPCSAFHPSTFSFNPPSSNYPFFPMSVRPLLINRNPSSTSAKRRPSRKVNIRCRFGGKLTPRVSDGVLQYVGGRTRMTSFRRDTTLQDLYCKMEDIHGSPVVICYKLPDQDLYSLLSISCAEDLKNMLDKYDCLKETSRCGFPCLHFFLFPLSNRENSLPESNDVDCNDNGLSNIKEVNGATKDDGFKTNGNDNEEGSTSMLHIDDGGDGNGNENTLVPEHQSLLAHSNINDEINVAPKLVNPTNDVSYVLPTNEELHQIHYITPSSFVKDYEPQQQNHQIYGENFLGTSDANFQKQDPWNIAGPSNVDLYFEHFTHTQEINTDETDENHRHLIALVESVLPSPYLDEIDGATKVNGFKTHENVNSKVLEHRSFLALSNINDKRNLTPQIVNLPNDLLFASPTYEEPHQITPFSFAMTHEPQSQNHQLYGENFLGTSDANFQKQDPWNIAGPSNVDSYFVHFAHTQELNTEDTDENHHHLIALVESVLPSPYIEEIDGATMVNGFKTYENDNNEGSTSMLDINDRGDGKVLEHQSFLTLSNINDKRNVTPQIVNLPNDLLFASPTFEEPHQITPFSFAMAHEPQSQNHQLYGENYLETSDLNSIFKSQDLWNVHELSNADSYFGHFTHAQGLNTEEEDEHHHNLIDLVESVIQSPYCEKVNGTTNDNVFKTYNKEGTTSILHINDRGDGKVQEHQSFLALSNINDEINMTPQIVNPANSVPYASTTYEEPLQIHYISPSSFAMAYEHQPQIYQLHEENFHGLFDSNSFFQNQDLWNVHGPLNIDPDFEHFRHTRDIGTYEEDEDLQNLDDLVESVLQSP